MSIRTTYLENLCADAQDAFAQHVIKSRGTRGVLGWWTLQTPGRSNLWTEISEHLGGYLYVNGDCDLAVFGIYPGQSKPGELVSWMARPKPDNYMAQKLSIGMGSELGWSWDAEVAAEDFQGYLEDSDSSSDLSDLIEDLRKVRISQEEFNVRMYDLKFEDFAHLGQVPSTRLVYAWAALNRLKELL